MSSSSDESGHPSTGSYSSPSSVNAAWTSSPYKNINSNSNTPMKCRLQLELWDAQCKYVSGLKEMMVRGDQVRYLEGPSEFDTESLLTRYSTMQAQHTLETVLWAYPLHLFQSKFCWTAMQELKSRICAALLTSANQGDKIEPDSSSVPAPPLKKKPLKKIREQLNERITVAMLADIKTDTPDVPRQSNLLFAVLSKFESLGRQFSIRTWARMIKGWMKDAEDPRTAVEDAVLGWIATQENDRTEAKESGMGRGLGSMADSVPDPQNSPAAAADDQPSPTSESIDMSNHVDVDDRSSIPDQDSSDTDDRSSSPPALAARAAGGPAPHLPSPRSKPWSLDEKSLARSHTIVEGKMSTCDVPSGLPMVSMVLVAGLDIRAALSHADPRFAVNFFYAPDNCGEQHLYPTSVFKTLASNLISVSDFAYVTSCVAVTAGKVNGADLQRTLQLHCHYTHAVAILCVRGIGKITIKSRVCDSRRSSFSEAVCSSPGVKAGFVIVLPGQTILMDQSAREATWCLVGLSVTDLSPVGMVMPIIKLQYEDFQRRQLLKLSPLIPADLSSVFLRFDDNGRVQEDRRFSSEITSMLQHVFYRDCVFGDLSMDQARMGRPKFEDTDSTSACRAVASMIPNTLEEFGTRHIADASSPDLVTEQDDHRKGKPFVMAFLGGPWTMVKLRCGSFHAFFHARAGGIFVQDCQGCGENGNDEAQELYVHASPINKIGDRPGTWLFMDLVPRKRKRT